MSEEYLIPKRERIWFVAGEEREQGFTQFLDDKSYKPALGMYNRETKN